MSKPYHKQGTRQIRQLFIVLGVFVLALSTRADAGTCNGEFGWRGKGTSYNLAEGSFIFTGEFSGTFFNTDTSDPTHKMTTQCPGLWHVKKGGAGTSNGACIARDADGDKIFFEWSGTGKFPVTAGPFELVGGTGKFAGISGGGKFKGVSVASDDGGNGMGYATWTACKYTIGK